VRATKADIDLSAIAHNVRVMRDEVAPAMVCAVVKADGYGHGAVAASEAMLAAGADWLAVALVEEGVVLRRSEVDAPILLLSQPRLDDIAAAVRFDLRLCIYSPEAVEAVADAAKRERRLARVHLKVDTGMHRVGAHPDDVLALAEQIAGHGSIELEGVFTHCAVGDEPDNPFTAIQLDRFDAVVAQLDDAGLRPSLVHAANSATAIDHPRARYDLVRAGIALYGIPPAPTMRDRLDLRPAMTLRSEVSMVKRVPAGAGISYGLRHVFDRDPTVATVPVGYADGVARRLGAKGGSVLVQGRRRAIVGSITMDQLMVDCGDDDVSVGEEVVLIGEQGSERITAEEWAERLGTIAYEVVCAIGPRVPRRYR
jgi:alanine racemase